MPPAVGRRAAQPRSLTPLVHVLLTTDDAAVQRDVLRGMIEALQGRRLAAPEGWAQVKQKLAASANAEVREKALLLSVMFGDPEATAALRKTAADPNGGGSGAADGPANAGRGEGRRPAAVAARPARRPHHARPGPARPRRLQRPGNAGAHPEALRATSPTPRRPTPSPRWPRGRPTRWPCSTRWNTARCRRATCRRSPPGSCSASTTRPCPRS